MLHEIDNVSVNELARLMDADPKHVQDWINFSNHFLDARLLDAGFEVGIGRILSDLRGNDQWSVCLAKTNIRLTKSPCSCDLTGIN